MGSRLWCTQSGVFSFHPPFPFFFALNEYRARVSSTPVVSYWAGCFSSDLGRPLCCFLGDVWASGCPVLVSLLNFGL